MYSLKPDIPLGFFVLGRTSHQLIEYIRESLLMGGIMMDKNELMQTLEKISIEIRLSGLQVDWMLVGSAGSVLQGCELEANDIDIYTKTESGVELFAKIFEKYAHQVKCSQSIEDLHWKSSLEVPTFTQTFPWGFSWKKGKWKINGCEVEAVHIMNSAGIPDSKDGEGIWEGGQYIWELAKPITLNDFTFKTVPLEVQLESNLRRERTDRVAAIIQALNRNGTNQTFLQQALSTKHYEQVKNQLEL